MITVRGLSKTYIARRQTHLALDGIDLDVGRSEFVVLLGPSGCGKTTLLRCIAGLETPDAGEITIDGKIVFSADKGINLPPEARQLGMVFQSYALWPNMTVFENVAYPLRAGPRLAAGDLERRVEASLSRVGLEHRAGHYPGQLSGGQQQRVSLARALVADRGLVLFDEPLSNLDAKVRERLRIELLALQRGMGFSGLYVTHDQIEALALADRIVVMNVGQIAQIGAPKDIYLEPRSRYVAHFVGSANELAGRIVGLDGDKVEIETQLGRLRGVARDAALAIGQEALAIVRPEHGRLIEGPAANGAACTLKSAMFLGPQSHYVVEAAGVELSIVAQSAPHAGPDGLHVDFDPERTLIFAAGQN